MTSRQKRKLRGGVFRAPADTRAARESAARAGCAWFTLDLGRIREKPSLLAECGRGLGLPKTFGDNWDALADCLQDWSWQPAPGYVLHLRDARVFAASAPAEYRTLVEILGGAAEYWAGKSKPFIALVDGDDALSPYPERDG